MELESGFEAGLSGAPCSSDLRKSWRNSRPTPFNLVVKGIPRKANETNSDIQSHFENYCLYKLGVSSLNIDKIHRLPDPNLVLVRFVCLKDRDRVWSARRTCKDLFIQQDHPKTARERANLLFRCRTAAERSKLYKSIRIAGGRLVLDEMAYRPEDLESLPPSIRPSTLATNSDDSTLVFFTRFSHFSNHRITPFSYKGERYNCMEKFITVARARLAKNREMEERAWKTHYSPELKGLLHIMSKDGLESRWETEVEEQFYRPSLRSSGNTLSYSKLFWTLVRKHWGKHLHQSSGALGLALGRRTPSTFKSGLEGISWVRCWQGCEHISAQTEKLNYG